ncbi:MAG: response regulator [Chlamydiia bacterium]|nr:response regulator [Chlamydiia bacterium]
MDEQKKILLIDDDESFCAFVKKIAESYQVQFHIANTLEEGRKKFAEGSSQALFVDGFLPDGEGLSLVREIREKDKNLPIALISVGYTDTASFQKLKEEFAIDFVLSKPVHEEDLKKLFELVLKGKVQKNEGGAEPGGMEDLQQEYLKTIPEKLTTFEGLIKKLEQGLNKTELENLKMISHKTAGSAGSYGFMDVTKLCRDMEQKLKEKIEGFKEGESHPEWIEEWWEFFRRLKAAFQAPEEGEKKEEKPSEPLQAQKIHIYLVDDDEALTTLLIEIGKKKGFEVEGENDPKRAEERLAKPEFHPDILLMDKEFMGSTLNGFSLLKKFRVSKGHALHTRLGMLTKSGDDQDRTEAMTLGVELFFEKPVDPETIFRTLQEVSDHQTKGEHHYHGIIVDDDKDFCNLVKKAAEGLDVVIGDYQSGDHFIETVEKENPDFVLLDIEIPPNSGLNLLEMLRSDFRFRELPVIMISSHTESENLEKAYELCVEDFIQKPVEEKMLQIRLKNFLRKYAKFLTMGNIDPETGLYHQSVLKDLFQLLARQRTFMTAVLLQAIEKEGGNLFDLAIKKGADKLKSSFREQDLIGVWEKGQFMLIFPKQKASQTKHLIERLFQTLQQEEPFKDHEEIAMCAGMAMFPDHGKDLGALARQAQQQLDFAISAGGWSIHSAEESAHERGEGLQGKKALIVDDDQDITQIIKNTFEARGMEVQVFGDGESAVDWMKGNLFQTPPDLIILDWMLPGMTGIEVLEQIQRLVGQSIPVIILSSLSQEQNVLEGLQKGASEYLTKPFSMQVLLEKTEGLLGHAS